MGSRDAPDLSHLSGRDIEKVAEAIGAGPIRALMANKEAIAAMSADDINKLSELAAATRANCGGIGCG
ncbi:hypothetical protein [Hoeflea sp.]|uniref:hypothetical protein n=1 Tax=Hoeflea sp. TaxID=1940281 RepID=UPI0019CBED47|nr:hypothetical protein [Hoeflea sp.]MBU4531435.1 hypothetical protein [Alphaproteobacteria bacterium]MBC7280965.1 hypothetical protein [Hoeflea sp.]MBU4544292.1 hypothetical protein [Alphaproteobacteria bacterium]MBU4550471.1 hypothetical protein [Alphaproteobacteria bacterium]MBV1724711.1 hypothetical protein [Hoeflea sp.]